MFEEVKDRVVFYFTKLDKEVRCFSFGINENTFVDRRTGSMAKLFDYYKPEFENIELYTIQNCNGSAESTEELTTMISTTGELRIH